MTRSLPFRLSAVLLLGALALASAGCGGKHPVATVSGKVTTGGTNPLPGGNISFYLVSDPTQVGGAVIKSDGTFEVANAPVGECKVVIDNTNLDTSKHSDAMMGGAGGMGGTKMGGPQPVIPGQSAASKDKMKSAGAKSAEQSPEMTAGNDTGTRKYVKIDAAFTKVETTSLRHTVNKGGESNVTIDVK